MRCWWCGKIEVYGSKAVEAVKRRGDIVYMHPKCARDHDVDSWGNAPPLHGGD